MNAVLTIRRKKNSDLTSFCEEKFIKPTAACDCFVVGIWRRIMQQQYTVGSMFAGIGGICLVFKQNGCKLIWANEIDKYAYALNGGKSNEEI